MHVPLQMLLHLVLLNGIRLSMQVFDYLADPTAFAVAAPAASSGGGQAAAAAAAAPVEEEEEEEEDMGFSLFD